MKPQLNDILTPQGYLSEIKESPSLDVMMNLFKIPRAFSVSGFGNWNVGQHSVCTAFLALYWSQFRNYDVEQRNRLMVLSLTHDLHESATGDILPGLKNDELKNYLDQIQQEFLEATNIQDNQEDKVDTKIMDILAFMYEIQQAQTIHREQKDRLQEFFLKQRDLLIQFCEKHKILNVDVFMEELGVFHLE